MKLRKYLIIILLFFNFTKTTKAQNPDTLNTWLGYSFFHKINPKWSLFGSSQYRDFGFFRDMRLFLANVGANYKIFKEIPLLVGGGYMYLTIMNYNDKGMKQKVKENRIYQQFTLPQRFGSLSLTHRYRIEERFRSDGFQLRLRYRLEAIIPISGNKEKPDFYANLHNEIRMISKKPFYQAFRIHGALGKRLSNYFNLELGWMRQINLNTTVNQLMLILRHNF